MGGGVDEIWRPIPSLDGWEASSLGNVRHNGRFIVGSVSKSTGYRRTVAYVSGARREVLFHRLVAEAFLGLCPQNFQVNHIDADKSNNRPPNLEYVTCADNLRHAWRMGLGPRGARHGRYTKPERSARGERVSTSKLTPDQVIEIRSLRAGGASYKSIAAEFGISTSQAFNVASGAQWRHI